LVDTETYAIVSKPNYRQRFEGRWLKEENVGEVVSTAWEHAPPNVPVMSKLAAVHSELHEWDRSVLKAPQKKIRELTRDLDRLLCGPMSEESTQKQKELTRQIEVSLEQEEVHYMQRSRANWLMHGDKNTTFFHNFVKARRKRNTILKIKNDEGNWVEGNEEMGGLIHSYFSSLFSSEVEHTSEELLSKVIPRVMAEMNSALLKPYTVEEVKQAMFSIGDYKAPGINGLHAVFYKKFWAVVGDDVTREVLQVLNSGVIPSEWNETAIVLIPKVQSPELITQFRPISLCNVIYKVVSKVLSRRLKALLPEIISKNQSAFVPGRLITDNVLVAYESFHTIKNKRQGNRGICAVKLDMHKSYDRVEWNFLRDMMLRLGFDQTWVNLCDISELQGLVQFR
jgi:hypothetical protein